MTDQAIHLTDTQAQLITLGAQYPGAREGVLIVAAHGDILPMLNIYDMPARKSDVTIWSAGLVWRVSDEEITALRTLSAERVAAKQAKRDAEAAEIAEYRRLHPATRPIPGHNVPCPYCHTYCCGDCRA